MASFYSLYYSLFAAVLFSLFPVVIDSDIRSKGNKFYDAGLSVLILIAIVIVFGSRDINIGTDTSGYVKAFNFLKNADSITEAYNLNINKKDPFFNVFTFFCTKVTNVQGYLYIIASLFVIPLYITALKLVPRHRSLLLLSCFSLAAFPNLGVNVIRSGISLSLAILSITFFLKPGNRVWAVVAAVFSLSFHFSSIVIFAATLFVYYVKMPVKAYYFAYVGATVLAFMGIGILDVPIIGPIVEGNERFNRYASGQLDYDIQGMGLYTFVFQTGSLVLFVYFLRKIKDKFYSRLLFIFILLSIFYFLCLNVSYSYRFGMLSWMLIPYLLVYPFKYQIFKRFEVLKVIVIILIFTLFSIYRIRGDL